MSSEIENTKVLKPDFNKRDGLLPVIVQEASSGLVLMLGYANEEAFKITLESRLATFYSTSRKELWTKGLTSGDQLKVLNIFMDCDQDAIIYQVEMMGKGACHTKNKAGETRTTCFYRAYSFEEQELKNIEE